MRLLINIIAFQLGWLACVLGAAYQRPWIGVIAVALVLALHLWRALQPWAELKLALLTGTLGAVLDSLPVTLGLLTYPAGMLLAGMAPYWIVAMWIAFATTLNITFRWLRGRWALMALLGALAGPLAYYAGAQLGGVTFTEPTLFGLLLVALIWSTALPTLMALAERFDGMVETDPKSAEHSGFATAGRPESPRYP